MKSLVDVYLEILIDVEIKAVKRITEVPHTCGPKLRIAGRPIKCVNCKHRNAR